MKKIRYFGKILYWIVLFVLIAGAGFIAIPMLHTDYNYKIMTVLSGSMEPSIPTGSLVVVRPEKTYQKGEVISFKNPLDLKSIVTHRIYKLSLLEGSYVTKGDANKVPDLSEVRKGNILGKVTYSVPYVGYFAEFTKTKNGLVLIVMVTTLIIYNELSNIKKESLQLIRERGWKKIIFEKEN